MSFWKTYVEPGGLRTLGKDSFTDDPNDDPMTEELKADHFEISQSCNFFSCQVVLLILSPIFNIWSKIFTFFQINIAYFFQWNCRLESWKVTRSKTFTNITNGNLKKLYITHNANNNTYAKYPSLDG